MSSTLGNIAVTASLDESAELRPRPARWLVWLLAVIALVMALVLASRIWWGWHANHLLEARLAELGRHKVQNESAPGSGTNAADILRQADNLIASKSNDAPRVIELVSRARGAGRIDWGIAPFNYAEPRKPHA